VIEIQNIQMNEQVTKASETSAGNPRKRKGQKGSETIDVPAASLGVEHNNLEDDHEDNLLLLKYKGNPAVVTHKTTQKKQKVTESYLNVEAEEYAQHHGIQTFEDSNVDTALLKFPRKSSTWTPEMVF
jgi:hypothetical protein